MKEKEMVRLFAAAGRRHGFKDVTAEFVPLRDFKVKWIRNYRWISFDVCDYLTDAPLEVMSPLVDTVYRRICGEPAPYPQAVRDWIARPEFVETKRPVYISRFDGLMNTVRGEVKDLGGSLERLEDSGLVPRNSGIQISWCAPDGNRAVGVPSIVMRTAFVSTALDRDYVDDDLLDYSLYSLLAKVSMGVNPGSGPRRREYEELLDMFPERSRLESRLRLLQLHLRGVSPLR